MEGGRVLVVDDQADKRALLAAALSGEGFDVLCSCSEEAARIANEQGAHFAIVDLMLHGTNGFELARRLRACAPDVSVILTSDYHFSPTQLARMDCGAIAFVPRPYAVDELASFLRGRMEERRRSTLPPSRRV
jgi:DNA-binding response OmpR family regulator